MTPKARHILLTGFKASGKSTLGRKLAWQLGMEFLDLDSVLEDLYEEREGERLAFRDIFKALGDERFRALEAEAAREAALRIDTGEDYVLALGGGALHNPAAREALAPLGLKVYLQLPFEVLLERIRRRGFPAYVSPDDAERELRQRFDEREPGYLEHCDVAVQLGDIDHDRSVERILEALHGKVY